MSEIANNLNFIRNRIRDAALKCGRDPSSVKLIAVSKQVPPELIREAFKAGQTIFGENYAQDLRDKAKALSDIPIDWHFIGHLQKNKAKYVAPVCSCVETIDSREIAEAISQQFERRLASSSSKAETSKRLNCLIEVNVAGEMSKSGAAPESVLNIAKHVATLSNLSLRGLMAIPPYYDEPEKSRPYFRRLSEILNTLNRELNLSEPLTEISMGMSGDFEVAIEEGATYVRVGTAIFGDRV